MVKLTTKEKKFADGILEGKPKYKAALDAYDIQSKHEVGTASAIAAENLQKPRIVKYLEENGHGAATRIVKLSKSAKNETVRLNANKDILDRVGIGVQKQNTIVPIQINFNEDRDEFA